MTATKYFGNTRLLYMRAMSFKILRNRMELRDKNGFRELKKKLIVKK